MMRFKVNDYCEFPERINFKPWTKEGIRERENEQLKKAKNDASANADERVGSSLGSEDGDDYDNEEREEEEVKMMRGGEAIDADMESGDDEEEEEQAVLMSDGDGAHQVEGDIEDDEDEGENMNSIMDTGKYFDEGVMEDFIDIAADDEEMQESKRSNLSKVLNKNDGPEGIKMKPNNMVLSAKKRTRIM